MNKNADKRILDPCCGSRMFWFQPQNAYTIYCDLRKEDIVLERDGKKSILNINPDLQMDFRNMPFPDNSFSLVVFDPPHITEKKLGKNSWMRKKYGALISDSWQNDISAGFSECFRVLKDDGVLIFKWNEYQIPVSMILQLSPIKPLFGNRCGKQSKTHWMTFIK